MILVRKDVTYIAPSYRQLALSEASLSTKWRSNLIHAYLKRRQQYERAFTRYQQQRATMQRKTTTGILIAGTLVMAGFLINLTGAINRNSIGDGPALPAIGYHLIIVGLLGLILLIRQGNYGQPDRSEPPSNPLRPGWWTTFFEHTRRQWLNTLSAPLSSIHHFRDDPGVEGEESFIGYLAERLDDRYVAIHSWQPRRTEDVDVVLVGPSGIWAFEVKHVTQNPDQQWQRMAGHVVWTLKQPILSIAASIPTIFPVKGGIVFTVEDAVHEIAAGCPVAWGTPATWLERIKAAPSLDKLDQEKIWQIVDVLLAHHQQVSKSFITTSMLTYAQKLISEAEDNLSTWTTNNPEIHH